MVKLPSRPVVAAVDSAVGAEPFPPIPAAYNCTEAASKGCCWASTFPARDTPATGVLTGHETEALDVGPALQPVFVVVVVPELPPQPTVVTTEIVAAIEIRAL
jgi:hypothetical protein